MTSTGACLPAALSIPPLPTSLHPFHPCAGSGRDPSTSDFTNCIYGILIASFPIC